MPTDGGREWDVETSCVPPAIGHGVISEGGERYRIVDVWVNHEKHGGGVGEYGVYVYVEPATRESDRPGQLHSYYRS